MKKFRITFIVLAIAAAFFSCEKDDICDSNIATTPRMIVQFYYTNSDSLLSVTNLKVIAEGMPEPIAFNPSATDSTKYLASANKIALPLKITDDKTRYYLTQNAGNATLERTDTLEFNYSRNTIFISRACGFKTLFNLNNSANLPKPFILNNDPDAVQGNWIQGISVEKYNLETENETHLNIYFTN